jgi:hypothetical protein
LLSFCRILVVFIAASLAMAGPASAKTFGTKVVLLVDHFKTFYANGNKLVEAGAVLRYFADEFPALLDEVDSVALAAQSEAASNPSDPQAAVIGRIGTTAKDFATAGRRLLAAGVAGDQLQFLSRAKDLGPSAAEFDIALGAYRVSYASLLVDDPYWKVTLGVGVALAVMFAMHVVTWLLGKRSTLTQRERRRSRAGLAGRAALASLMNVAGTQLYRIPGAATSTGVRAGMAAVSVASMVFLLIGEIQQHIALRRTKDSDVLHHPIAAAYNAPKRPNWAPAETSVTQYIIPVGDIAPLAKPNDGVLLLGDFLRTGDEEAPSWHVEPSLVAAAVSGAGYTLPPSVAAAPTRPAVPSSSSSSSPSFAPNMSPTGRTIPPPPPMAAPDPPVRMAVPVAMQAPPPPPSTGLAAPPMPSAMPPPPMPSPLPSGPAPQSAPLSAVPVAVGPPPPPPLPRRRPQNPTP